MGMVTNYQLTVSYAAGSLGDTLERLHESLRLLFRRQPKEIRAKQLILSPVFPEPSSVAILNQSLRSVSDAWAQFNYPSHRFSQVDDALTTFKENVLNQVEIGRTSKDAKLRAEYHLLAQDLCNLRNLSY